MKVKIFDRKAYIDSLNNLIKIDAPSYVVEAYAKGYYKEVSYYYKIKANKNLRKKVNTLTENKKYKENLNTKFLAEARNKRDEDFLKAFFVMTNLDIVTGKRLPPNAGKLLKPGKISLGLKDLYKKLR
jgi:hypothetical protein